MAHLGDQIAFGAPGHPRQIIATVARPSRVARPPLVRMSITAGMTSMAIPMMSSVNMEIAGTRPAKAMAGRCRQISGQAINRETCSHAHGSSDGKTRSIAFGFLAFAGKKGLPVANRHRAVW